MLKKIRPHNGCHQVQFCRNSRAFARPSGSACTIRTIRGIASNSAAEAMSAPYSDEPAKTENAIATENPISTKSEISSHGPRRRGSAVRESAARSSMAR